MKIKTVLISQPDLLKENSPYYSLKDKYRIKVIFQSFIHIEGLSGKDIRKQKINLSDFASIILTSRGAADHLFKVAKEMRFRMPETIKYFCTSAATANYLQKYNIFRKRRVYASEKSLLDLKEIFKRYKDENFLLPTSDILNRKILEELDSMNLKWKPIQLYKTVSSDLSNLKDLQYDLLVLFSPFDVKSLFENFPKFKQNNIKIAAYGSATIQTAQEAKLKVNIQAPTKETPSILMAIENYLKISNK